MQASSRYRTVTDQLKSCDAHKLIRTKSPGSGPRPERVYRTLVCNKRNGKISFHWAFILIHWRPTTRWRQLQSGLPGLPGLPITIWLWWRLWSLWILVKIMSLTIRQGCTSNTLCLQHFATRNFILRFCCRLKQEYHLLDSQVGQVPMAMIGVLTLGACSFLDSKNVFFSHVFQIFPPLSSSFKGLCYSVWASKEIPHSWWTGYSLLERDHTCPPHGFWLAFWVFDIAVLLPRVRSSMSNKSRLSQTWGVLILWLSLE